MFEKKETLTILSFERSRLHITYIETNWAVEEQYGLNRIYFNQWDNFQSNKSIIIHGIDSINVYPMADNFHHSAQ